MKAEQLISPQERKLLIVDDDPDCLEIISEALRWEGYQISTARSGHEALEKLQAESHDLVVLDVNMPGMNGIQTVKGLRRRHNYVSVLFISGNNSSEAVIEGLDAGADDYIAKPFDPLEMLARVRTQLRIKDLNDQLRAANEKLKELVDIDDLTGLFNMRSLYQRLEFEMGRARRFNRQVCVVMMDMDFFKSVNDGHDHLFGSFVLTEVGAIVKKTIRNIDIGARYGGDEFLIVLTEVNKDGALIFCERLRKAISTKLFKSGEDEIHLTASLGFAITSPEDKGLEPRSLVRSADNALYQAKRAGRNCVRFLELAAVDAPVSPAKKKSVG